MLIKNNPLIEQILKNCNKYPNTKIIFDNKKSLTYKKLVNLALANSYNFKKIKSNYIPIIIDRNVESVIAILSVIFAGKIFCPISNSFPKERINLFIEMLKSPFLINCSKKKFRIKNQKKISLSSSLKLSNRSFNIKSLNKNFYLLFTSGTTGHPKGVKLSYENILNTLVWSKTYLNWNNQKIGIATQFSFDISMFDLFSGLYFATPMYILSEPTNPIISLKEIRKNKITSIFCVPTFFSNFIKYGLIKKSFKPLKQIISGGDFFANKDVYMWLKYKKQIAIFNVWGPTETSIVNTMYRVKKKDIKNILNGKSIPVGKSHPLMELKILKDKKEIKKNKAGEICMIGKSVSLGYLGNSKNSKNYFLYKSKRAYLTGDLGYLDDRNYLHIIGRKDNTIKISGFRIDVLEIENLINFHFMNTRAYLFKSKRLGLDILCLAVETRNTKKEKILNFLKRKLPNYFIPKKTILFKKFPLNQNNKIDRKRIESNFDER